ncbi:MAG: hypothetical protein ABEI86_05740 [Halobacteriaceae archaeon]
MPEIPQEDYDESEALAAHADRNKNAWQQTLEEMKMMAAEKEDEGWQTVVIGAGDTAPESPSVGETDRFGLVHVIPDNKAEPFREAFEQGDFPRYDVYRGTTESRTFLLTELMDPDSKTAIYIAGNFRRRDARGLIATVRKEGEMYTHVQKLDKTHLGSFKHDGYEKFFPNADRVAQDPGPEA